MQHDKIIESRLVLVVQAALVVTSLLVTDRLGTDPVNVSKMLMLILFTFILIGLTIFNFKGYFTQNKVTWISITIFFTLLSISVVVSENSVLRGFYGAFGRNTGLLTYFGLLVLFGLLTEIKALANLGRVIKALWVVGIFNVFYGVLFLFGFELFTWNNPYKKFLGTFGNPNFISAFLGIFSSAIMAEILSKGTSTRKRLIYSTLLVLNLVLINKTGSIQGLIVAAVGICIVVGGYIFFEIQKKLVSWIYFTMSLFVFCIAVMGTLQIGPLSRFLYKTSVSLRGEYWQAGINMGLSHPLFGVGLDSYGTYYRKYRDISSLTLPGVNTVTDAAHNVFIDILAGSGFLGLIAYVTLILVVIHSIFTIVRINKNYNPLFLTLLSGWIGYQSQSFISINQIGIAIWGWVFGGLLVAYSRILRAETGEIVLKGQNSFKNRIIETQVIPAKNVIAVFVSAIIGISIAIPPFLADVKMRQALFSQDEKLLIEAARMFPKDVNRMNYAVVKLAQTQQNDQLVSLAIEASEEFPRDYSSIYALYQLSELGSAQRLEYRKILHSIDPLNSEFNE